MSMVRLRPFLSKGLGRKTLTHSVNCILLYSSASSDGLTGMDLAAWSQLYRSVFINCYIIYYFIPKSPNLIYMSFEGSIKCFHDSSLSLSIVCSHNNTRAPGVHEVSCVQGYGMPTRPSQSNNHYPPHGFFRVRVLPRNICLS